MWGTRLRLFRLAGIPISLDASWLIILALLTWTLVNLFRDQYPELPGSDYWVMAAVAALAFFTCIILHELGHSLVARAAGMPVRGITLFLFGGVAELGEEPPSAASEFLMAIAGPIVSALLGIIFWLMAIIAEGYWPIPVVAVLKYLGMINLAILAFNLVPAFPLDGGRVLRSVLWGWMRSLRRATYWAAQAGQVFAWFLIIVGVLNFFVGHFIQGIWLWFIGMFLKDAALSSYRQVLVRQVLHGEPVARFMTASPVVVPSSLDLRQWVEDYVYRYHRKAFPVTSNGHLEGFVTTQALEKYPREDWNRHTVSEVMRRDLASFTVAPQTDAMQALAKMQNTGSSRLLVVEGDQLMGIVSLKDLLAFLDLKLELEDEGARQPAAPDA
jgi:Zn-dependent protease